MNVTMKLRDILKVWGGLGFIGVLLFVTGISPKMVVLDVINIVIGSGIIIYGVFALVGAIISVRTSSTSCEENEDLLDTYMTFRE